MTNIRHLVVEVSKSDIKGHSLLVIRRSEDSVRPQLQHLPDLNDSLFRRDEWLRPILSQILPTEVAEWIKDSCEKNVDTDSLSDIDWDAKYDEGWRCCDDNGEAGRDLCPYVPESDEWKAWMEGYEDNFFGN